MKPGRIAIEIICSLLIFLFVYAAVSKLSDFQKFRVELGQSPLLTAFTGLIAWVIPLSEISIAILLCVPRYRILSLYASFCLMTLFSAYIFILTRYSAFVPCSCGGILQNMTWNQHLIFNIFFIIISMTAIFLHKPIEKNIPVLS